MTELKVGITRVSLETVDLATPGLGWAGAPGDSVDASAAEEGLGWAGLGGWAGGPSAARTEHSLTC